MALKKAAVLSMAVLFLLVAVSTSVSAARANHVLNIFDLLSAKNRYFTEYSADETIQKLAATLASAKIASAHAETPSQTQVNVEPAKHAFVHSSIPHSVGVWTLPTVASQHALLPPLLVLLMKKLIRTMLHPTKPPSMVTIMLKLYYGFDSMSNVEE
ncbi:hypothetical protein FNV43_RR19913 [Rhamnella rubrinervis]|uniref:Uncharacterized protein n=1 Tax=Rhamnella rubrinervis TaxID=2594499 RepID=A0A8K0E0H9_9ROSA|nr:hypothetical protein FNV43_RR19913 [Rhamnella rubrinervis]